MLLGIKNRKTFFLRHVFTGLVAALVISLFWLSWPEFPFEVRLWRALGDTAFSFLFVVLVIGPLAKLWRQAARLLPWRREMGIWFALLALSHFIRVRNFAFLEPGIELPRLLGLIALFWSLVLAASSSDRAVNFLGPLSWKWLHGMAYVIFYMAMTHAVYFLFWRYPEANRFQSLFLVMALTVPVLQIAAFIKEVVRQRVNSAKMKSQKIKLPIKERKIIAEETCEVSFDLTGKKFQFLAGQYIQVSFPKLLYSDPKGISRTFSIASSPGDKNKLSIAFRDSGSGFKRTLMELPLNSLVEIEGPFGHFTFPKDTLKPLVFIAGGIGITPFLSMIRFVQEEKLEYSIILLYANRTKESAAYLEELEAIAKENPRFILKNKFGRIDARFIQENVKEVAKPLWYLVGPPPMVAATREVLFQLGIEHEKIYLEEFTGYQ